jgi:starch phosphorylase
MTATMNGAINLSTFDGWVCEYAKDGENSFIIPPADPSLPPESRDRYDMLGFYSTLQQRVLPLYYDQPFEWSKLMLRAMNDIAPAFDADRMAAEYYTKIYA